uniref:Uncharacterized protein n=1 Tax=Ananas comosus var. bracteatus TaxID=296719 RepID=A0A6V7Q8L4_ANACO|nr:unnamed protein product [Ananas comosus var. bracteatus]
MDNREGREHRSAGELDDETIARRRSRRVSFAETTAVHVFDREDDLETPPESRGGGAASAPAAGVHVDQCDSDDSRVRRARKRRRGRRKMMGKKMMWSRLDENFFGPVSTSFIRSGRPSDSGMSEDSNHDITLDSTAFSLHFRSIAPPDDRSANSAGSLRTPTTDTVPTSSRNLGEPAGFKKIFANSKLSDGKASANRDGFSDMSLVADNPSRYDYGRLSPTLEALLNEVNQTMMSSPSKNELGIDASDHHIDEFVHGKGYVKGDHHLDVHISMGTRMTTAADQIDNDKHLSVREAQSPVSKSVVKKSQDYFKDVREAIPSETATSTAENAVVPSPPYRAFRSKVTSQSNDLHQSAFEDQQSGSQYNTYSSPQSAVPALVLKDGQQIVEAENGMRTPKDIIQAFQSPFKGSVSSLRAKREQLFVDSVALSRSPIRSFSLKTELLRHDERISAIKDRMSKRRMPGTPINGNSKLMLIEKSPVRLEREYISEKMAAGHVNLIAEDPRQLDLAVISEQNVINSVQKNKSKDNLVKLDTPSEAREHIYNKNNEIVDNAVDLPKANFTSHLCASPTNIKGSPLTSHTLIERPSTPKARSPSVRRVIFQQSKTSQAPDMLHKVSDQDIQSLQESTSPKDFDLVGRKRRLELKTGAKEDRAGKIIRREESPTFSPNHRVSPRRVEYDNEVQIEGPSTQKDWANIFSDVLEATKVVFSASISGLMFFFFILKLDNLEDLLGELQRAIKYDRLSTSLRNHDRLGDQQPQRVVEARLLQVKLLYEQAKLQLNRLKLDRLRNKAQLIQFGVQECSTLKWKISQLSLPSTKSTETTNNHCYSISCTSSSKNQEELDRVTLMRHEKKVLEQKTELLTKSLEVFCKIKESLSCDRVIKVATENLRMRNCCRRIHQDLQLWKLSDIVRTQDQREIVLNYCNFLFLRFTIRTGGVSNIVCANIVLNEGIVERLLIYDYLTYPNMNASKAVEFVFRGRHEQRVDSSKCLPTKTLEISMLLGNVVNVLEEVQTARMELLNLACSTFEFQPGNTLGRLELLLCFMDLRSGRKLTLALDMTDLNSATYPSEPSELQIEIRRSQTTQPPKVLDEILAAVKNLQSGRPVILKLCRLISNLVRSSSN